MKTVLWQAPETATDEASTNELDTPLTDVLLDQFSAYYIVAVLAVRALEEARRQRARAEHRAPALSPGRLRTEPD